MVLSSYEIKRFMDAVPHDAEIVEIKYSKDEKYVRFELVFCPDKKDDQNEGADNGE